MREVCDRLSDRMYTHVREVGKRVFRRKKKINTQQRIKKEVLHIAILPFKLLTNL